jgi:hypothetical protein
LPRTHPKYPLYAQAEPLLYPEKAPPLQLKLCELDQVFVDGVHTHLYPVVLPEVKDLKVNVAGSHAKEEVPNEPDKFSVAETAVVAVINFTEPPPLPDSQVIQPTGGWLTVVDTALLAEDAFDVPTAFVAVTVNVYDVPAVKPLTVIGDELPVAVTLPGLDVTVYWVIAEPPLFAGALNDTDKLDVVALPALTPVGGSGLVAPAPPIIMFLIDIKLILRR